MCEKEGENEERLECGRALSAGVLYVYKGAHTLFTGQRERVFILKGMIMMGALAPFSYLVL